MKNGWTVRRMDNTGLADPMDGFSTPKVEWRVYPPNSDIGVEQFRTKREALAFIKAQESN